MTLGVASAMIPSPAMAAACVMGLSIPSVPNDTAAPSQGQPLGMAWVTTMTGAPVG
jgi:hypothetical protein